jgi:tRNA threonylcarbamoyl adenosine modification protein (Sua5/YciO/YrdC/YwlC family)
MIIEINPFNIDDRLIKETVGILKKGGIIVFPTDTVYSMGCDLHNKKALNELARLKGSKLNKTHFSIICSDISQLSMFVKQMERPVFKLLKQTLPGPFTYILTATNEVSRLFDTNRKEIGIRIPDQPIALRIVELLGHPIATTSLHNEEDQILEYYTDPAQIYEQMDDNVDLIIDGGIGKLEGSTVVDCTGTEPVIVRKGLGELNLD